MNRKLSVPPKVTVEVALAVIEWKEKDPSEVSTCTRYLASINKNISTTEYFGCRGMCATDSCLLSTTRSVEEYMSLEYELLIEEDYD